MFSRIQKFDDIVLEKITRLHRPTLNRIMRVVTHMGTAGVVWFLIAIPFFFTRMGRIVGTNMVMGLSITHVMGEILIKHIVCRERPCHKLEDEDQIIDRPKYYSFPSGHSASSFCMAMITFLRCRWYIFLPVLILASAIAFSRLYLRVHYLTDILVGILIGLICGGASVSLVNYVYFDLTYNIMKHANPTVASGMPMAFEHIVTELIVWSIVAVIGLLLIYFFHRRNKP